MKIQTLQNKFNSYIRKRDLIDDSYWICISCGKKISINDSKNCHAGHYAPVKWFSWLRFDVDNCHSQCSSCNRKDGNFIGYRQGLIKKIGIKKTEELEHRALNPPKQRGWNEKSKDEVLKTLTIFERKIVKLS